MGSSAWTGLVTRGRKARNKATGTTLSRSTSPNDLRCADYKGEFMLSNRRHCYPLTATDFASRYLISYEALCIGTRKINLSTAFAGQNVGIRQVDDRIWPVSFMQYALGFFDHETYRITSAVNPFSAKVLPMSSV